MKKKKKKTVAAMEKDFFLACNNLIGWPKSIRMNEFVTKKIRTNKIKRKNRTKAKKIIIALWPSTCKTCVWCTSSSQLRRWIGHFKRIYTVDDKNNVLFLIVNTRKHAADELKCNAWKRSVTEIVVETTRHIHPLTSSVSLWRLYQVSLLVAYTHTKMHFCRWHTGPNVCVLLVRCQPEKKWRRKQTAINLLTKNEIHKKKTIRRKKRPIVTQEPTLFFGVFVHICGWSAVAVLYIASN